MNLIRHGHTVHFQGYVRDQNISSHLKSAGKMSLILAEQDPGQEHLDYSIFPPWAREGKTGK